MLLFLRYLCFQCSISCCFKEFTRLYLYDIFVRYIYFFPLYCICNIDHCNIRSHIVRDELKKPYKMKEAFIL